jgi:sugar phosphate permease
MLGFCNFTINAVRSIVADWGPTMLQEAKGFSSSEAGTVIMLFEFAGIGGMLLSGWMTDRLFAGRAPRLCAILMLFTAAFLVLFCAVSSPVLSSSALILAGFMLYGPQALTGVSATNLSSKSLTGTAIGFISLFSYIGVSVSGKMCGSLAQSSGGWSLPVYTMAVTSVVGMAFFVTLWRMPACRLGD